MVAAGRIFDLQRFSLHDGPGIRTTVFLKGCPLRCRWCHNPESQAPGTELSFDTSRCTGCAACIPACTQDCHHLIDGHHSLLREDCTTCGTCVTACAQGALRLIGRDTTTAEVIATALRDRGYYDRSGGGLTVSGGEPLAQAGFTYDLCAQAKAAGLHTVVETSGHATVAAVERLLPVVDLWLVDWKCSDPLRHYELTGVGHELIRATLARLSAARAPVILRCPLIPGLNDEPTHFDGIAALASELPARQVELMAYHDLGIAKAGRIGRAAQCPRGSVEPAQIQAWITALAARGCTATAG
jgi:glycyl-radical enzyme activating protein